MNDCYTVFLHLYSVFKFKIDNGTGAFWQVDSHHSMR